ncbi:transporter substrate-binding domain-containing protein [Azoarcus communis]|uniref:ABC transporter substrate-binding protein n=1 Tax=Parazoarcus communis SWub3 = DSM 12120 TaxID=1121029 RepID=A0A323VA20_9RHOO|nr:transporter substrate-binding domain-containing protein [Parazoarcus communis]NMG49665.1 transporter substrate-binding domain-containing protein [Parazoarcus communis]NMG70486.1 transporter substrate-binding domain-containing protein [Parazoarcus communis SWub3 = DSM 12120]PZA17098.1 ABC transporter substrate-binding protein [Azoarcus communis] [Parazoarcus communis SWub3 = DSM 12120]
MKNDRRHFLLAGSALLASAALPGVAGAAGLELQQAGALRIAVYADFAPWSVKGKGIDIDIGKALAGKLGLRPEFVEFPADEDMNDDLRNMVWRGHYLGTRPGDVMLHVPVDKHLAAANDKVSIFAPYHLESMAVARNPQRVPPVAGSAANAFEVFTRERIGAEVDTHGSDFMLHVLNGRLRDNVTHYRSIALAVAGLKADEVAAVIGTRTELEAALSGSSGFVIDTLQMPEMRITGWPLGMAVKAESQALEKALGDALADLQRSGELASIFSRHGANHRVPGDN